ncbi:unnamed protein product [Ixodes pacificus]
MSTFSEDTWLFGFTRSILSMLTIPVEADSTEHFTNLTRSFLTRHSRSLFSKDISGLSSWYSVRNGFRIIAMPRANFSLANSSGSWQKSLSCVNDAHFGKFTSFFFALSTYLFTSPHSAMARSITGTFSTQR